MKGDKKIRKQLEKLDMVVSALFDVRGVNYQSDDIDRTAFVDKLHEVQSRLDKLFEVCDPGNLPIDPGW